MNKIIPYDPTKTFMYPNGHLATPEKLLSDFPAVTTFPHVIETDDNEEVCFAVMSLSALKTNHGIAKETENTEAIAAINEIMHAPPPEPEPSPEERIAAALEYQNLLTLDDAEPLAAKAGGSMSKIQARYANNVARGLWTSQMLENAVQKGVMPQAMYETVIAETQPEEGSALEA